MGLESRRRRWWKPGAHFRRSSRGLLKVINLLLRRTKRSTSSTACVMQSSKANSGHTDIAAVFLVTVVTGIGRISHAFLAKFFARSNPREGGWYRRIHECSGNPLSAINAIGDTYSFTLVARP
jgi:hypothetical protein